MAVPGALGTIMAMREILHPSRSEVGEGHAVELRRAAGEGLNVAGQFPQDAALVYRIASAPLAVGDPRKRGRLEADERHVDVHAARADAEVIPTERLWGDGLRRRLQVDARRRACWAGHRRDARDGGDGAGASDSRARALDRAGTGSGR